MNSAGVDKVKNSQVISLSDLSSYYLKSNQTHQITGDLATYQSAKLHLKGILGSADAFIATSVFKANPGVHLFILADKEEAAYFLNNLETLNDPGKVLFYPASYRRPYEEGDIDNINVQLRAEVLSKISKGGSKMVVSYPEALTEKVVTKKLLEKNTLSLAKQDQISIDFICELLNDYEFDRVDFVTEPGQFSIRGGIVDIFSFSYEFPYRVELFGDKVESIRSFEIEDQYSKEDFDRIMIVPNVQTKLLRESRESFLTFLPENAFLWMKDIRFTVETVDKEIEKAQKAYENLSGEINRLQPVELLTSHDELLSQIEQFSVLEFGRQFYYKPDNTVQFSFTPQPSVNKNFELLASRLEENSSKGFQNLIFSSSPRQIERLYSIFEDTKTDVKFTPIPVAIHEGFVDNDLKLACFTDHQIFERYHRFNLRGSHNKSQAITLKELYSLKPGDFITHIDHGVGVYDGLEKIEVHGKMQEAIRLLYKDGDLLYISIHSLHRVAKYSAKEGTLPKVNKLGSNAWSNLKKKTKRKVKDIARELIALYAKRKTAEGFRFSPDTYLQHELEASFIYEDTPDQEKATRDVKKDMEESAPMDRLICGDVGFGKTEIAIRAAFKAVADNKQVAILVPTTILTLQHFKTFSERLSDFPCTVDYLNRFKSKSEQKETLKKLAEGKVDIIIGTHRLVSKDVKFKNLGLLVVDEEQKFGVSVKDKLKSLKVNVDTLTLTATPIPRTLQFSLMSARDLSVINTPPPNRYPIVTQLQTFNEEVIRDAITYEVDRGGQVFFVHNRVQNINDVAIMVERICPGVKVLVAHGQLEGADLEKRMLSFIEGNYDVLVATTIIESGLDIPNANTIIVHDAHRFGLSDLHQMRGRVGRSNKKAFCYLLAPPLSSLTQEARKRLKAIEEFSDLGSGFNIAMRDLDIRGAGNILGAEQSGFIAEIGFDMYNKILNEAITELKKEEFNQLFKEEEKKVFVEDCQIDSDLEILIPDDYVNSINERLNLYRELSEISEEEKLHWFQEHLRDRFGPVPRQVYDLLEVVRLKWVASSLGFEKLLLKNNKLICYFISDPESGYYQSGLFTGILNFIQTHHHDCRMKQTNDKLRLIFDNIQDVSTALNALRKVSEACEVLAD